MLEEACEGQVKIWGPLATILWGVVISALFLFIQTISMIIFAIARNGLGSSAEFTGTILGLKFDGYFLSATTFATTIIGTLVMVAVIKLKRGAVIKDYLGLVLPQKKELLKWLSYLIIFIVLSDVVSLLLDRPVVPEFITKTYSSMQSHWMLWLALVVAAPLFEELFFRGFLLQGLSTSRIGTRGAIVISSAAWAIIHVQYDLFVIATIFLMGILLGAAKVRTGSVALTIFLHSFANLVATIETSVLT